jgi:hypothetical protein
MLYLPLSLQAWNTSSFDAVFKKEICALNAETLPLQQGLSGSSYASADDLSVTILKIETDDTSIFVKAGLFYTGIIAGCSCADDPAPLDENNEYCEVIFSINKKTAETTVSLVS